MRAFLFICQIYVDYPLNWPKLLRPFKIVFNLISMCMCSQCDSTSLPVQRIQIKLF